MVAIPNTAVRLDVGVDVLVYNSAVSFREHCWYIATIGSDCAPGIVGDFDCQQKMVAMPPVFRAFRHYSNLFMDSPGHGRYVRSRRLRQKASYS